MQFKNLMFLGLTAAAFAAFAQTTTTTATTTRTFAFPPAGLASSETAQVNVVNTAAASSNGTAASCTGSISFLNSAGTAIGTATTFTVGAGVISSAKLPFGSSGATGTRTEIRAEVTQTFATGTSATTTAPCSLTLSFETYDATTGATHIYLTGDGAANGLPGGFGH
jgi:hypothetical protein